MKPSSQLSAMRKPHGDCVLDILDSDEDKKESRSNKGVYKAGLGRVYIVIGVPVRTCLFSIKGINPSMAQVSFCIYIYKS